MALFDYCLNDYFFKFQNNLQVLKMMTGTNLSDLQLQQIVDKTVIALDKDSDGKISFEEFKTLVKARSTVAKMSFDMSKV